MVDFFAYFEDWCQQPQAQMTNEVNHHDGCSEYNQQHAVIALFEYNQRQVHKYAKSSEVKPVEKWKYKPVFFSAVSVKNIE